MLAISHSVISSSKSIFSLWKKLINIHTLQSRPPGYQSNSHFLLFFFWNLKNLARTYSKKGHLYVTQVQSYLKQPLVLHLQIKFILSFCETEMYLEDPKELEWEFEHEEQTGHILTVLWKVWSLWLSWLINYLLKIHMQTICLRLSLSMNLQHALIFFK